MSTLAFLAKDDFEEVSLAAMDATKVQTAACLTRCNLSR
jgi:hypothetical protein